MDGRRKLCDRAAATVGRRSFYKYKAATDGLRTHSGYGHSAETLRKHIRLWTVGGVAVKTAVKAVLDDKGCLFEHKESWVVRQHVVLIKDSVICEAFYIPNSSPKKLKNTRICSPYGWSQSSLVPWAALGFIMTSLVTCYMIILLLTSRFEPSDRALIGQHASQ